MSDFVLTPDGDPIPVQRNFSLDGVGNATGTYSFSDEFGPNLFRFDSIQFDVEPIPEPGTLLLLAGAVATLFGRRRKGSERRVRS